ESKVDREQAEKLANKLKKGDGFDLTDFLEQLKQMRNDRTRLLALGQMSNVTGGCPDLAPAIALAHAAGARVMIDGAQGVVHDPADVQRLDIDFYAFSGHKLYGPTGIGALYGKSELLAQMAIGALLLAALWTRLEEMRWPIVTYVAMTLLMVWLAGEQYFL
ncbi:aminotransferase class V-fold PLP-dependent enzyme, partial [Serratia ureilytica]|nr:aminotransferase class V-fold PLP-dependent enzyme [Serratia ureilytica]